MASAAARSKAVVPFLSLCIVSLIVCGFVRCLFGPCFVMQYSVCDCGIYQLLLILKLHTL